MQNDEFFTMLLIITVKNHRLQSCMMIKMIDECSNKCDYIIGIAVNNYALKRVNMYAFFDMIIHLIFSIYKGGGIQLVLPKRIKIRLAQNLSNKVFCFACRRFFSDILSADKPFRLNNQNSNSRCPLEKDVSKSLFSLALKNFVIGRELHVLQLF